MKNIILSSAALFALTIISQFTLAQSISAEEKALQSVNEMEKRLGLKQQQIQQIYVLNLTKIQKTRQIKNTPSSNFKRIGRSYNAIREEYRIRLRSVLTPEQFQRWEILRDEAKERRKTRQTQLYANNTHSLELNDPEAELEHFIVQ